MKKTRKAGKTASAEAIARLADQGKDISGFFKRRGRMVQPIQRVNVDLTAAMLAELDQAARDLNVSRQAVIKTLVRQALDQHYLAHRTRQSKAPARLRGAVAPTAPAYTDDVVAEFAPLMEAEDDAPQKS